jgi:hypothetical protein
MGPFALKMKLENEAFSIDKSFIFQCNPKQTLKDHASFNMVFSPLVLHIKEGDQQKTDTAGHNHGYAQSTIKGNVRK